jgi:glycosyltransferase involved in cell wall biosynthesis
LFNAIDVFVLASQSESFGVVFLEAWSCSKPVVGTRMGATESLLTEGKDSLLFMPGDVDELCQRLTTLIENKPLRVELGLYGFEKVKTNYTWPTIIKAYRDAYLLGIANFATVTKASIVS